MNSQIQADIIEMKIFIEDQWSSFLAYLEGNGYEEPEAHAEEVMKRIEEAVNLKPPKGAL